MLEHCAICGCQLHRTKDTYARPTVEGRSHATSHHYVAERFFGRSTNHKGTKTDLISNEVQPAHKKHQSVLLSDASLSISTREFARQAFA